MSFSFHFCSFSYSGVCSDLYELSLSDVRVFKKSSTGDGKFTLFGWNYKRIALLTFILQRHWNYLNNYDVINRKINRKL